MSSLVDHFSLKNRGLSLGVDKLFSKIVMYAFWVGDLPLYFLLLSLSCWPMILLWYDFKRKYADWLIDLPLIPFQLRNALTRIGSRRCFTSTITSPSRRAKNWREPFYANPTKETSAISTSRSRLSFRGNSVKWRSSLDTKCIEARKMRIASKLVIQKLRRMHSEAGTDYHGSPLLSLSSRDDFHCVRGLHWLSLNRQGSNLFFFPESWFLRMIYLRQEMPLHNFVGFFLFNFWFCQLQWFFQLHRFLLHFTKWSLFCDPFYSNGRAVEHIYLTLMNRIYT